MSAYLDAKDLYARLGVDTESALKQLSSVPISLHCWQGDDVGGFESPGAGLTGGGIQATGNYPGKARTMEQLRQDMDQALGLIPGTHRINVHASYGEFGGKKVDRDAVNVSHFQGWIDWAKQRGLGLDFNPTFYSHPLSNDGFTLTSADAKIRDFWIAHGIACRKIGAAMGEQLGTPCVTNLWIPDGAKEVPVDRVGPRQRLISSLNQVFAEKIDPLHNLDAVESKLFGIGSESYVPGSHEFYLGYAVRHQKLLCLDAGHFHPTESVADKLSSIFLFVPEVLLHVSRGVRWDSDHVVLLDDPTRAIMEEVVRGGFLPRTHIGLDYFDASINRIAAWVIGTRNALKALLLAFLEPSVQLRQLESSGDYTGRLALLEEAKSLPWGAVWDEHLKRSDRPGVTWIDDVRAYERTVLAQR